MLRLKATMEKPQLELSNIKNILEYTQVLHFLKSENEFPSGLHSMQIFKYLKIPHHRNVYQNANLIIKQVVVCPVALKKLKKVE